MDRNSSIIRSDMASCEILLRHRNLLLHWASSRGWFASRGYELWYSSDEGASWTKIGTLRTGWANWCSRYPFLTQAGRLGIHNLICLSSGTLICIADGAVFRSTDRGVNFFPIFSEFKGRRPLRMGICQDDIGRIYLGEYWMNRERDAVRLWRSDDDGITWFPVHMWPSGTIRHIHFVQFDRYEQLIWVGTGDSNSECQIACSQDGGVDFEVIGEGSQIWRAVSVLFTPEALYWGTDIGIDQDDQPNHIIRLDRSTLQLRTLVEINGPAYYSAQTTEGTLAVGTAVEGGRNEKDKCVHLYLSEDHYTWNDIRLWRKRQVPPIFGPATITFPISMTPLPRLLFNANLVRSKSNGALFEAMPNDYPPDAQLRE